MKKIKPLSKGLSGIITIPADKSISHRAVMLSSLSKGICRIKNFSNCADCTSTLNLFKSLGIIAEFQSENDLTINSRNGLQKPLVDLDCGNSGTTMRLCSGILAGQNFNSTLFGDESLSKRPMKRILTPLKQMGAEIKSGGYSPLEIFGKPLQGINYVSKLSSAQVKSCILLAGIHASGETSYTEPYLSRNHTEIMLEYMNAELSSKKTEDGIKTIIKPSKIEPKNIQITGDISSAAFFLAAALIIPDSDIIIKNVGLNYTRTGILDVLQKMGADIEILDKREISGEIEGDLRVKYSKLKGCEISGEIIPRIIDELPIIAVIAAFAQGITSVKNAEDLRNKESDRIKAIVNELKKLKADIKEMDDGFEITGKNSLKGNCSVTTYNDHRLAMSLYVAGMACQNEINIENFDCINISFPNFESLMQSLM